MEIWLIRHGETEWNATGRIQGWTDVPLNIQGVSQAERLADHLKHVTFEHIYSSDLSRAKVTAETIAKKHGDSITVEPHLREQHFGSSEGLFRKDVDEKYPDGFDDGESSSDVESRVMRVLQSISKNHQTGPILVTTHGGVVRAVLRSLGHTATQIGNTSITRLKVNGEHFKVIAVNETPHL